jgi:hypothetical protein
MPPSSIARHRVKLRREGQHLPRSKIIYVFRCGDTGLYALTADRTGRLLPSQLYGQIRWRYDRCRTLQGRRNNASQEIIKATLDAVEKHGFYLTHAAMEAEFHESLGRRMQSRTGRRARKDDEEIEVLGRADRVPPAPR